MRKILAVLTALVIMTAAVACAGAETADLFDGMKGRTFEFSSGVGGWSTELIMGENGSFTGNFHDSEMGLTGEGYPDGTVYRCSFHGQLSDPVMTDEYTWTVKLATEMDEGQEPEVTEDGIHYVKSVPYGVEKAQTVVIFLPGMPVDRLPEGFVFWSHLDEIDPDAKTLPYYAIWNETDEAGFISDIVSGTADEASSEGTAGNQTVTAGETENGSAAASADEWDPEVSFTGNWVEKDTQFITMSADKMIEGGWDVEIISPISHGAWVIRATVKLDVDDNTFTYKDGVKYDLLPGEEIVEKVGAMGLQGTLKFSGTADDLRLEWYGTENPEGKAVVFERAPGLPAYAYSGDDPIEGAIANALATDERAERFLTEPGYVTIPCPIIHKTEMTDDAHAKVYGSFWVLNYARRGRILENIAGGEYPAIITLEKTDGEWRVTAMEEAGMGEDYAEDIERFAGGDSKLADQYFAGADLESKENKEIRTRFIKAYVEANGLDITAYYDYGWDPVLLN